MNYIFKDKNLVGLVREGRLVELHIKDDQDEVGSIYRARVEDLEKSINAAFVDIGEDKNAFLSLKDARLKDRATSIDELFKPGDSILVQKTKSAIDEKGSKLSRNLELRGRYIVLTPYSSRIRISKKIRDQDYRLKLQKEIENFIEGGRGLIIRTQAYGLDLKPIKEEYSRLMEDFKKIEREINFLPTPKLIYKNFSDIDQMILREETFVEYIVSNDRQFIDDLNRQYGDSLELIYDRTFSLEFNSLLYREFKKALGQKIYLDSGASIVIDELESLTAIDINTQSSTAASSQTRQSLETNKEAAREIALQIRLRNLAGIILIDFINMYSDGYRQEIIDCLAQEFKKDSTKTVILGFTKLGILELTRERRSPSLSQLLLRDCEKCGARGKVLIND